MIAHLTGVLLADALDRIILGVGGVGYEVWVPLGTQGRLEPKGHELSVHIHTSVREDAIQLFGFASVDEKRVFERLIAVSGVGPKLGLAILSTLSPNELVMAVNANDIAAMTRVPGVGKKKAQRLILDLKSKFDGVALDAISPAAGLGGQKVEDLRSALGNLGYSPAIIDDVCSALAGRSDEFDGVDDMLREAFKLLR